MNAEPDVPEDYWMDYIVFGYSEEVPLPQVEVYINHQRHKEQTEQFLRENTEVEFDGIETALPKANSTMYVIFRVEEWVDGAWRPCTNASVRCFIVHRQEEGVEDTYTNPDGTLLRWNDIVNGSGMAALTIRAPYTALPMWFIPEFGLGGGVGWLRLNGTASEMEMMVPERRVSYVVYNISNDDLPNHLWLYHHTFVSPEEALEFLNASFNVSFTSWREKETLLRNDSVKVACLFMIQDVDGDWEWVPLVDGYVNMYILEGQTPDLKDVHQYPNGSRAFYSFRPDVDGHVKLTLSVPDVSYRLNEKGYHLLFAVSGGLYDPFPLTVPEANWTFNVVLPPAIEFQDVQILEESVFVGSTMTVVGNVSYIETGLPVRDVHIAISGVHVWTADGMTDENGNFRIEMQAPVLIIDNLTLHIVIDESREMQRIEHSLVYHTGRAPPPPPPSPPRTTVLLVFLLILGTIIAILTVSFFLARRNEKRH